MSASTVSPSSSRQDTLLLGTTRRVIPPTRLSSRAAPLARPPAAPSSVPSAAHKPAMASYPSPATIASSAAGSSTLEAATTVTATPKGTSAATVFGRALRPSSVLRGFVAGAQYFFHRSDDVERLDALIGGMAAQTQGWIDSAKSTLFLVDGAHVRSARTVTALTSYVGHLFD